jgi:16S rRNA (uracil1498-N3)-methyltransferase
MRHVPHVLVPRPWDAGMLHLDEPTGRHLREVLRVRPGDPISYTDGAGNVGRGTFAGGAFERGPEREVVRPPVRLTLAVSPPKASDRLRFLVEKAAELGVDRLEWLRTRHTLGRLPKPAKAAAWATAGLQQSRGAWAMELGDTAIDWDRLRDLGTAVVVARPGGPPPSIPSSGSLVVAVGPEGGFAADEVPGDLPIMGLGPRVLRVETAALAVAVLVRTVA